MRCHGGMQKGISLTASSLRGGNSPTSSHSLEGSSLANSKLSGGRLNALSSFTTRGFNLKLSWFASICSRETGERSRPGSRKEDALAQIR